MSNLKVYKGSENYVATVVALPAKMPVKGLDNLVAVHVFGNSCLISKDSPEDQLYLFFPAETQLSEKFLAANNLYRHSELNKNQEVKGFFEDSGRVKTLKFKGEISTGFIIPAFSLLNLYHPGDGSDISFLKPGDEFNEWLGYEICNKYISKVKQISEITKEDKENRKHVSDKFVPEHMSTSQLLKNVHKLDLNDIIAVTYKLHGVSARWFNAPVKRKFTLVERIALFFGAKIQKTEYNFVAASRRVIKSIGDEIKKGNHYHTADLFTRVGKELFDNKLNEGEAVYGEIVGRETRGGKEIQGGYSYLFNEPKVFIYRISNINSQGIEIDLPYLQMKERALQLGVDVCPEFYYGTLKNFIMQESTEYLEFLEEDTEQSLNRIFYNQLLEKRSILDKTVVEEGFCLRVDKYPQPNIYKVKSKKFLLNETRLKDEGVEDAEELESIINE